MLSPFKKKLIMSYITRNIERGYIDLADNQISEHIEDFSEVECETLYNLLENKMSELAQSAEVEADDFIPETDEPIPVDESNPIDEPTPIENNITPEEIPTTE